MLARDLITDDIPPIKSSDSGVKALKWMDEFKVSHLPVTKDVEYLGMVSDSDILDLNQPEAPVETLHLQLLKAAVSETQHIFDVIKIVAELNLTVIPVIDEERNYIGAITLNHLMRSISNIASINEEGGILILEMSQHDYSMAEISQIVEGNDAKILSSNITSKPDSTEIEVTLKINKKDLSAVLQTFNRYSYTVKASFQESIYQDDVKDRFDALMNYLKM